MTEADLFDVLSKLEPAMELFVPDDWAEANVSGDYLTQSSKMVSLGVQFGCNVSHDDGEVPGYRYVRAFAPAD